MYCTQQVFHSEKVPSQKKQRQVLCISPLGNVLKSFFFFFQLEYNCFTMFCYFVLYNNMIYIHSHMPYILNFPPSHPSRASQSTELSSLCYTAPSTLVIYFTQLYVMLSSQLVPPSPSPWCPHSILNVCITSPILQMCPSVPFAQIPYIGVNV